MLVRCGLEGTSSPIYFSSMHGLDAYFQLPPHVPAFSSTFIETL